MYRPRDSRTHILLLVLGCAPLAFGDATVTTQSLLGSLINLESLTRFPQPAFRVVDASSVDTPLAVASAGANNERTIWESAGPGAIVSLWLETRPKGTLRIYLDGAAEPRIAGSLEAIARGEVSPFIAPYLSTRSSSLSLDFPILFQNRCRVTVETDSDAVAPAFGLVARLYDSGTMVKSFSPDDAQSAQTIGKQISDQLAGNTPQRDDARWDLQMAVKLSATNPVSEVVVPRGRGGMISELKLRVTPADPELLRQTILTISFDDVARVRVPIVEFFGTGPQITPYASLLSEVRPDGEMIVRWPMPFVERAVIAIEGPGPSPAIQPEKRKKKPLGFLRPLAGKRSTREKNRPVEPLVAPPPEVSVEGVVTVRPYDWDERSMYFQANFVSHLEQKSAGPVTLSMANLTGRGVYVGSHLAVANTHREWWGGGMELGSADDVQFEKSAHLESDFGLSPRSFLPETGMLRGQTYCQGPRSLGWSSLYRWRFWDGIPFNSALRIDRQLLHEQPLAQLSLSAVNYWYASPWHSREVARLDEGAVRLVSLPERVVPRVEGAIEGESLVALRFDGEAPFVESRIHQEANGPWSSDAHLAWRGQMPDNELVLGFQAPTSERYRVLAHFSRSFDYGIFRIAVNEKSAGDAIDLFHPEPIRAEPIDLGVFDLKGGENRISVRAVSSSKSASPKNCGFGLDCLVLVPVPNQ